VAISQESDRVFRDFRRTLIHKHTAQPDGVVDVIGVGVVGARMEQDAQTVTIEHQPRQK
jgi:hypothetical protein